MKLLALLLCSAAAIAIGTSASYLLIVTAQTEKTLPALIDARAQSIQDRLMAEVGLHAVIVEELVNARTTDLLAIANGAIQRADVRTADATQAIVQIADHADSQITGIRTDLNGQLGTLNSTLANAAQPIDQLAARYTLIPDQLAAAAAPSWAAIEPEITDRRDGHGYVGWHSRITGLMGEAVNIGGVFTQHFPALSTSITGISVDAHTFTSRAVAPRGFWGNFKDVLGTSSGVVRAGAAAGIF